MSTDRQRRVQNVVPLRPKAEAAVSDAAIVDALKGGDRSAAVELYRRNAKHAERMIVRICGMIPEREDILHDVFIRAIEKIDTLRDPSALRSWIMGIAVRRAREHLRSRRRTLPV